MQARTQIGIFAIIAVAILTLFIVNAVGVFVDGSHIGTEENIDFVAGANMTITGTENPGTDTVTITFASAPGTSTPSGAVTSTIFDLSDVFETAPTSSGQIIVMGAAQFTNVSVSADGTLAASGALTVGTSTRLRADPSDCGAGDFANAIDAVGDLTCATPAGSGGGAVIVTEENNSVVLATTTTYDFQDPFDVTDAGGFEADISIDFTEVATTTFSSGVDLEWTFNTGTTSTRISFGEARISFDRLTGIDINHSQGSLSGITLKTPNNEHQVTGFKDADVYGDIGAASGNAGLLIFGINSSTSTITGSPGISLDAGSVAFTSKTSPLATVEIRTFENDGPNKSDLPANSNLFLVANLLNEVFILDAEGTIHLYPGSDTNVDLINVQVTGDPIIGWDETNDRFTFNQDINITDGGFLTEGANPISSIIFDEGVAVIRRKNLDFTGAGVTCTDNAGATSTVCNIPGGGGGGSVSTEEDNALVLATTTTYDFGSCFDATDAGGNEADITFDFTESCGELTDLTDVNLSATSSAQILLSDGQWINVTLSGDASLATSGVLTVGTSTRLRADPTDCGANTFATSIDPEGDLTCTSIDISDDTNLAVSGTLLDLTGDTLSINEGTLTDNNLCDFESTGSQLECTTNTKAELEGIITDVADFAEADGDTFTGVHDFGGATSLELPLCGTTSLDGQVCSGTATSTAQLVWFHGEQHVLSATTSKGLLLFAATSTDDFALWNTDQNIIVTKACFLSEGGVWVGDLSFFDVNGNSGATLMSGDITTVAGTRGCTGGTGEPTMSESTIQAQSWVGIDTTSSATNDRLHITFWYKLIL